MKHVVYRDERLKGWEYGMLRSMERVISEQTGASILSIPDYPYWPKVVPHLGQGMTRAKYRKYLPTHKWTPEPADVAWYILMGPENYRLDLMEGWKNQSKYKILYLFDTLPAQYGTIERLFRNNDWDLLITAFADAVPDLERITKRKWKVVEQAADRQLFGLPMLPERAIDFSSYGRRHAKMHTAVSNFCAKNNLYYDYTTHDGRHPAAPETELYQQYAWHVKNSKATFSWAVETTNPQRAGHLKPVTCRWFEALASGTVIIGNEPANPIFRTYFPESPVIVFPEQGSVEEYFELLEDFWRNRIQFQQKALDIREKLGEYLYWEERIERIQKWTAG